MSARKYRPGAAIRSLPLAVHLIEQGRLFYWIRTDIGPRHPKVLANMTLATLASACRGPGLILAEPIEATP